MRGFATGQATVRPLHLYLVGTGSWFASFGIQSVMFAWLVTMVLRESPQMVGVAQMAMLVPALLFMLIGGSLADRYGGQRVVVIAQSIAVLPPLGLLLVLGADSLSFGFMIGYALMMGCAQAFVTPARDALLNQVAEGKIQRTVVKATMIQFVMQMVAFLVAGQADRLGPELVVGVQILALAIGAVALGRIVLEAPSSAVTAVHPVRDLALSVVAGWRTVMRSASMRMVAVQNIAVGMFFMGSYIVTIPLLVRDRYDGSAGDLALLNAANALGLVLTIFLLLRVGDIHRQGRALLLAHGVGAVALGAGGVGLGFPAFTACIFAWGACGGIAMTMARTIMQEQAPDDQRGRVMGFFSFSFMGAGPIGAVLSGFMAERWGPEIALTIAATAMLVVVIVVSLTSKLWSIDTKSHEVLASEVVSKK